MWIMLAVAALAAAPAAHQATQPTTRPAPQPATQPISLSDAIIGRANFSMYSQEMAVAQKTDRRDGIPRLRMASTAFRWGKDRTGIAHFKEGLKSVERGRYFDWRLCRRDIAAIRGIVATLGEPARTHAVESLREALARNPDNLILSLSLASLDMPDEEFEHAMGPRPVLGMSKLAVMIQNGAPLARSKTTQVDTPTTEGLAYNREFFTGTVVMVEGRVARIQEN